jgi:hypothetical protein
LAGLTVSHPLVGDEHHHAERKDFSPVAIKASGFGHGRHGGVLTEQVSPDFGKLGKYRRRIREVSPEQMETGGKIAFFERADDEVHSLTPRAEVSAFRT